MALPEVSISEIGGFALFEEGDGYEKTGFDDCLDDSGGVFRLCWTILP